MEYIRLAKLKTLQAAIGYEFKDISLLDLALTHTSYAKGDGNGGGHNERLEFLGDAVLELCVSERLFSDYPELSEGVMTRVRATSVCEGALHGAAVKLGIGGCLLLSHGEEHSNGRAKPSILADAMEAIIGAVFLDGGIDEARKLVMSIATENISAAVASVNTKDYKTILQEYAQKHHLGNVAYELAGESGPDHKKTFTLRVVISGEAGCTGSGLSKQEAGQNAARATLAKMGLL